MRENTALAVLDFPPPTIDVARLRVIWPVSEEPGVRQTEGSNNAPELGQRPAEDVAADPLYTFWVAG